MGLAIFGSPGREVIIARPNIYKRGVPNMCILIIDGKDGNMEHYAIENIYDLITLVLGG
jgi:hypothetical protein